MVCENNAKIKGKMSTISIMQFMVLYDAKFGWLSLMI